MLVQSVARKKTSILIINEYSITMKRDQNYLTPEISEYEISTEGLLCGSVLGGNVAGGGELNDNSWDYTNI